MTTCPTCGSAAQTLLNLVDCITPQCKNYSQKWATDWLTKNGPQFTWPTGNESYLQSVSFLGRHKSKLNVAYDLYHAYDDELGYEVCIAKFGAGDDQAYYVDIAETEIGLCSSGSVHNVSQDVQEALKQALTFYKKRKKFLVVTIAP